ncbi:MAG: outer membrane lipoprotein carrier protein LolA [Desulfobacteraceae bacterium]
MIFEQQGDPSMKHTTMAVVLTVCLWAFFLVPAGAGQEKKFFTSEQLDQLLAKTEKNFGTITTVKTRLTQKKKLSVFSETIVSKGFCLFKAPDKLRLEYTDPFKSSLIVNRGRIFKYEFYQGQWQKLNPGNREIMSLVMENITSWLRGEFQNSRVYEIKAFSGKKTTILLIPKHDRFKEFIQSFELVLNSRLNGLDAIRINETREDFTHIVFHGDVINQALPDAVFSGKDQAPQPVAKW